MLGTALVVGGGIAPLTATRSLAAAGYRVIVGTSAGFSIARFSRYANEVWAHPPHTAAEDFVAAVMGLLAERSDISVILPTDESFAGLLAAQRDQLPGHVVLATPTAALMQACVDKERMNAIALATGVPYPDGRRVSNFADLAVAAGEIGYPLVVKPNVRVGQPLAGRKAVICRDEATLRREFERWPETVDDLLVQAYVTGPRQNVHFIARRGRVLARMHTIILRTDAPDGTGVSVSGVTVAADPRMDRYCAALVEALDYTGVGVANFIVPADGEPQLLEINPRNAGTYRIAERAGLPLTLAAIDLASDPAAWRLETADRYRLGRRYVWTSRELFALATAIRRQRVDRGEALKSLVAIFLGGLTGGMHMTWERRDPKPTLALYAHLARSRPWAPDKAEPGRRNPPEDR